MMSVFDRNSGYAINAPDVVAEDFDGQTVVLNLSDGRYFSLEGIASRIWDELINGCTPQAIFDRIGDYQPSLREEAGRFIGELVGFGLIRPTGEGSEALTTAINHEWPAEPPRIEVFDDLAELIFADPIHDVDEQVGWPARPAQ
jgi:hypothetical protein